jgi:hypothetical protein
VVSARRNIAWRGGSGPWDDASLWEGGTVPYSNNTISCRYGTIVLTSRSVSVYDATIKCQIQSPLGYGIQVQRALRMQYPSNLDGQGWLNVSSLTPTVVEPLDFIEQVVLDLAFTNFGGWTVSNNGNGIAEVFSLTKPNGLFVNRGNLTLVAPRMTIQCSFDWNGAMVIASSNYFTIGGSGTLGGVITMLPSSKLVFEGAVEKWLRSVTLNMHDTAIIEVDQCYLRLAAPMDITVTNWLT